VRFEQGPLYFVVQWKTVVVAVLLTLNNRSAVFCEIYQQGELYQLASQRLSLPGRLFGGYVGL